MSFYADDDQDVDYNREDVKDIYDVDYNCEDVGDIYVVDYNCEDVEDIYDVESRFGSEAAFRSQENIHSVTMKTLRGEKQQRQGGRERF